MLTTVVGAGLQRRSTNVLTQVSLPHNSFTSNYLSQKNKHTTVLQMKNKLHAIPTMLRNTETNQTANHGTGNRDETNFRKVKPKLEI